VSGTLLVIASLNICGTLELGVAASVGPAELVLKEVDAIGLIGNLVRKFCHLSIESPERTLSDGMHWLLGTYGG